MDPELVFAKLKKFESEVSGGAMALYRHRGSVATTDDLPTSGNTVGDIYNVTATGMNYVWTVDSEWDSLGEIFRIDSIESSDIENILAT